jgi:type IV pilus assembly protein PilE
MARRRRRERHRRTGGHAGATGGSARWRRDGPARDNRAQMFTVGTPAPLGRASGFTLIEIMVVLAVAAILAVIAMPSFLDAMRKGRRAEAVKALGQIQQAQERWRATRSTYTTRLAEDLQFATRTPAGYYDLRIEDADGNRYTLTAAAVAGTSQANDRNCSVLRVRLAGGNLEYGGCADCAVPDGALTDPDRCWSR